MNIWQHCLLSQRKFGGQPQDYEQIHSFIDSSKYFYHHVKHRLLLHNMFGVELATELIGNLITNSDQRQVLVRDIAVEHCREDLNGRTPTLYDWLNENPALEIWMPAVPEPASESLQAFIWRPFFRSNLKASLNITCSDFGVFLAEHLLGIAAARELAQLIAPAQRVQNFLAAFKFTQKWQYTPQREELKWLKQVESKQ
ncbi:DUF6915 family protein [Microscilla marina]|uniref:DUF6915 domain-containing protein n=1 Tax=Microscilla marina ATCC 23134 TaxID=313606 RepID=A1ZHW3_MICM2|nr:hypothetical protein [Microscilla marina]EAY30120.1 hypothetical protein M23134_05453 [Microscilla marina ATCC 23134]